MKYAIIYEDTIHHEGDERSRTHPGHGYPAYSEEIEKLQTFDDIEGLKRWIKLNSSGYSRQVFKAIQYEELKVSTEIVVGVTK